MKIKRRQSTPNWIVKTIMWGQSLWPRGNNPWYVVSDREIIPLYPEFRSQFSKRFVSSFTKYDGCYWSIMTEEVMAQPSYHVRIMRTENTDPNIWGVAPVPVIGDYRDTSWAEFQLVICSTFEEMQATYWKSRETLPSLVLESKL